MEIPDKDISKNSLIEILFDNYAKKLISFAISAWKFSEDDAWEVLYDTFFHISKVFKNYEFSNIQSLSNFVITSFNNRLRNKYKDIKKYPDFIDIEIAEGQYTINDIELDKMDELLERALDELEDWERILLLQRACEIPYKNISELTGKPEDQLKVYHKRVLSKLCRKLEELQKTIKVQ